MKPKSEKKDVRKMLAEQFIQCLEESPLSWHSGLQKESSPVNGIYNSGYGGYNRLYLMLVSKEKGYTDNRWYTQSYIFGSKENREKPWDDETKIKVIKGESPAYIDTSFFAPTPVGKKEGYKTISPYQYYQLNEDEKKNYYAHPIRKPIPVYNGQQVTGIPEQPQPKETKLTKEDVKEAIEKALQEMKVGLTFAVGTPCYSPAKDEIYIPELSAFQSEYHYFATLLHEMGHSTGHPSRLNRNMEGAFGSPDYAIEELRAEIASCFMSNEFGLDLTTEMMDNHKAYVQSWAQRIREDENVLVGAIYEAEKIANYIEEKAFTKEPEKENGRETDLRSYEEQPKFEQVKENYGTEKESNADYQIGENRER